MVTLGRTMSKAISLINKVKPNTVTASDKNIYGISLDLLPGRIHLVSITVFHNRFF